MKNPICIHPKNRKVFEFRGKPLVLICATEHYGAVMNRPFDYKKYLADASQKKQTLTRLFTLFRELQTVVNPYSTCKPESNEYISPFLRTGPGRALDIGLKYNLDIWNPEFFERLHNFLSLASKYSIIVELTLLSSTYADDIWALNPLNPLNNINEVGECKWYQYLTARNKKIFEYQCAYVKKIVSETCGYDNIIYEICNEPGGGLKRDDAPPTNEVNDWMRKIAKVIVETEEKHGTKHLISGQEAVQLEPWEQHSDLSFDDFPVDIVNIHPLSHTTYREKEYDMGDFMSGQLKLKEFRDYCLAVNKENKPLNMDEDNSASRFVNLFGWTIHRKRAWTALFCGCHYDFIDFSINNYLESGTPDSQKYIRSWFKNLSVFIHSIDLISARPINNLILDCPDNLVISSLQTDTNYYIYFADAEEKDIQNEKKITNCVISLNIRPGNYKICFYDPKSDINTPGISMISKGNLLLNLPDFSDDIVASLSLL